MQELAEVRLTAWVHGYVQGVGFRWWTRSRALELGLTGFASNRPDGRVQVVAQGPRDACERLLDLLQSERTPGRVEKVDAARGGRIEDGAAPGFIALQPECHGPEAEPRYRKSAAAEFHMVHERIIGSSARTS